MHALWMVLAAFFFACMGVCVKFASPEFNAAELVFYRGLFGVAFLALLARSQKISLRTAYPGMHAWRSLVGVCSLTAWFYAIAHLPLATAITLNYLSSVWIAAFLVGAALLAWRPNRSANGSKAATAPRQGHLVLTVLAGFGGVLMLLRPTVAPHQVFAAVVGLASGLAAAFAYLQVVALSRMGEPELRIVFYFSVGSALAGAAASALGPAAIALAGAVPVAVVATANPDTTAVASLVAPGGSSILEPALWHGGSTWWLLPLGLFASLGQLCLTRAYSQAKTARGTLLVANLQYCGIVFGAAWGVLLFNERIPWLGWVGMVVVVASGVSATLLRQCQLLDKSVENC